MKSGERLAGGRGLATLRRRSAGALATAVLWTCLAYLAGRAALGLPPAWLALALAWLLPVGGLLAAHLPANHAPGGGRIVPRLGLANLVTLSRGVLLAWTAGFLAMGSGALATGGWVSLPLIAAARGPSFGALSPGPSAVWLPALCYGGAVVLDAVDGRIARTLGVRTALGATLDARYDGIGILTASLVGVVGGILPAWYLAVGAATYAFAGSVRVRRRRGDPVYPLPERRSRRLLAGLQMAFLAVALVPPVGRAAATAGAVAVGGAYLLGFCRDWLYVTGRLGPSGDPVGRSERDRYA